MRHRLTMDQIQSYEKYLILEEHSAGTVQKYMRDVRAFFSFLPGGKALNKEIVMEYKVHLAQRYAVCTANSVLAAVNGLLQFLDLPQYRVRPFKLQKRIFRDKERELTKAEYLRLLEAAKAKGNQRLFLIMETLCATGIRISELQYITVRSVREGRADVSCKGKVRMVLLTKKLCRALGAYCKDNAVGAGPVFVTKTGRPMNRSNIWAEMKRLCVDAGVDSCKVFPHNFRHLFAITYYNLEKDIAKLADLLGHASILTTRIYVMESGEEHIRQVEQLGLVI
jgi:integrase/recombinase XerD